MVKKKCCKMCTTSVRRKARRLSQKSPQVRLNLYWNREFFLSAIGMRQIGVGKETIHFVWDVFPQPFCRRLRSFESFVPRTPFTFIPTLLFRINIFGLWFQLLGGCDSRNLWHFRLSVRFMLGQSFLYGNALILSLPTCFFALNSFVMSKVFDIFGVVV